MLESCRSLPKAGYGEASCFPWEEAQSLSHYAGRTCSTHAARAEPQRRAVLVVAEDRVEPSTAVSRCHSAHSCSPPASVPAAGSHSTCAVSTQGSFWPQTSRFLGFTTIHSYAGQGRKEGNREWSWGMRQTSHDCPCAGWGLPALHTAFLLSSPSHKQ